MSTAYTLVHFISPLVHLCAVMLLTCAVAGPISKITLLTITSAPDQPLGGALGARASSANETIPPKIMLSILGSCWRVVNGSERCTSHSFQPDFSTALAKFSLSADAIATIPPTLNATPGVSLFATIIGWLALVAILLGLSIVHLRSSQQPKLMLLHPRAQLGLVAARRIFVAAMAMCFISFFFGITAALAFDREFAQVTDAYNALSSTLPDGAPNFARSGTAITFMFVAVSFIAASFFATGYEYIHTGRKPVFPKRYGDEPWSVK